MQDIYLVIYGLRTCPDCDEIRGYFTSDAAAQAYCDERNEIREHQGRKYKAAKENPSYCYEVQEVSPL